MNKWIRILAALSVVIAFAAPSVQAADATAPAGRYKVVFQVSDNDPAKWNLALNNMRNLQQDLGRDNVELELVAYGPGLNMLKLESPAAGRIAEALASGASLVACENTMTNTKTTKAEILPNVGYVKAGVVELVEKQRQGWAYIRP